VRIFLVWCIPTVNFCFVACGFGTISWLHHQDQYHEAFFLYFFLWVSQLCFFCTVNPFWIDFGIWCKIGVQFHVLHVDILIPQHHLLENNLFPMCVLVSLSKISYPTTVCVPVCVCIYLWSLYSVPLVYMSIITIFKWEGRDLWVFLVFLVLLGVWTQASHLLGKPSTMWAVPPAHDL
jgi:hypothetical protein